MSRCTGHCCKSFWLPLSPMEFDFQVKRINKGCSSKWNFEELKQIADMVIYQRPHETNGYRYTCKFLDNVSGNCTNYENRPKMCRDYPYGNECAYKGCTMKKEFCSLDYPVEKEFKYE